MRPSAAGGAVRPQISGVVVHWGRAELTLELVASWPRDPRFELVVVDNRGDLPSLPVRVLSPGRNLGFGGGANAGVAASRGEVVLLLNPDAVPLAGALEALAAGFAAHPEAAGLAPRLEGPEGEAQWKWQVRPLPSASALLAQALLLPSSPARREPAGGSPVEQPAAAALALRRSAFTAVGGFDPAYYPAWFEDVDLALRLRQRGLVVLYCPEARFSHRLGSSVPELGFGPFLWIYYRNLGRYLRRHHGAAWAGAARLLLALAAVVRFLALPLRRPRRASSRREAALGLGTLALGAVTGFRRPASWAARWSEPPGEAAA